MPAMHQILSTIQSLISVDVFMFSVLCLWVVVAIGNPKELIDYKILEMQSQFKQENPEQR